MYESELAVLLSAQKCRCCPFKYLFRVQRLLCPFDPKSKVLGKVTRCVVFHFVDVLTYSKPLVEGERRRSTKQGG